MILSDSTDDQLMATAAHRYCLGRQSYIVGSCLDWLVATWDQFTPNTRRHMVRDTIEALMEGRAGSPTVDEPGWRRFAEWAWGRLDDEGRAWVGRDVAWKGKPWPLDMEIGS